MKAEKSPAERNGNQEMEEELVQKEGGDRSKPTLW